MTRRSHHEVRTDGGEVKQPTVTCGYCGNEFMNHAAPNGRHPCPQCRSRKTPDGDGDTNEQ